MGMLWGQHGTLDPEDRNVMVVLGDTGGIMGALGEWGTVRTLTGGIWGGNR